MVRINTSPLVKKYTLEEFWELPEPPDHSKLELIAGVLYMTPPPGYDHDSAVMRLIRLLTGHLLTTKDKGGLYVPRAAIWTTEQTCLEPDLFYVSAKTQKGFKSKRRTTADLVIEVISPGSAIYDRNTKADTYAALGVKELWLVDEVEETVEVRKLAGKQFTQGKLYSGGNRVTSSVLKGLVFNVRSIFADG
jgi:Uma2 family endonuclease